MCLIPKSYMSSKCISLNFSTVQRRRCHRGKQVKPLAPIIDNALRTGPMDPYELTRSIHFFGTKVSTKAVPIQSVKEKQRMKSILRIVMICSSLHVA